MKITIVLHDTSNKEILRYQVPYDEWCEVSILMYKEKYYMYKGYIVNDYSTARFDEVANPKELVI